MLLRIRQGWSDIAVGVALFAIAAYVGITASGMPTGRLSLPGPGMFPLGVSILLGISAICVIAAALRNWKAEPKERAEFGDPTVVFVFVTFACAAGLFVPLGFVLTAFISLSALYWRLGGIRIAYAIVGGGASTALFWTFFVYLLKVQLPAGPLGF
jgi:hypothetical protein